MENGSLDRIIESIKASKEKLIICFDKVDRFSRNVFDKRVSYLYEMAVADKIERNEYGNQDQ